MLFWLWTNILVSSQWFFWLVMHVLCGGTSNDLVSRFASRKNMYTFIDQLLNPGWRVENRNTYLISTLSYWHFVLMLFYFIWSFGGTYRALSRTLLIYVSSFLPSIAITPLGVRKPLALLAIYLCVNILRVQVFLSFFEPKEGCEF